MTAKTSLQESLALAEQAGDVLLGMHATAALGGIRFWQGAAEKGIALTEQSRGPILISGHSHLQRISGTTLQEALTQECRIPVVTLR